MLLELEGYLEWYLDMCGPGPPHTISRTGTTWSAFTFQQMVPQKLSFDVHYWSARASIRAIRRSADMAARARDC